MLPNMRHPQKTKKNQGDLDLCHHHTPSSSSNYLLTKCSPAMHWYDVQARWEEMPYEHPYDWHAQPFEQV